MSNNPDLTFFTNEHNKTMLGRFKKDRIDTQFLLYFYK